jgi:4a-hydroxytetrahydrobiopterin dehydratase
MPEIILTDKKCVACENKNGIPPLTLEEIEPLMAQLDESWDVSEDEKFLGSVFEFENFVQALEFVNKVGALAEEEGHHPDISLGWGYVEVILSTHAIDGLSENDFILAAKIDQIEL